jgi:hypothetical protein
VADGRRASVGVNAAVVPAAPAASASQDQFAQARKISLPSTRAFRNSHESRCISFDSRARGQRFSWHQTCCLGVENFVVVRAVPMPADFDFVPF